MHKDNTEANLVCARVIHVDGPYQINFDGQFGGCFSWNECGLQLTFPHRCSQQNVEITMSTFLPFRNEIHPGLYIVSEMFKFHCNVKKFDKSFTLCLQHCIDLRSSEDCHNMCFIIQHGDTTDVKCGHFEVGSSCGTVELNMFCCISIAWIAELLSFKMIVSPVSDTPDVKDNSSQVISTQPSSTSSEPFCDKSPPSNSHHSDQQYSSTDSPSKVDAGFCEKASEQEVVKNLPPHKYEEMLVLPIDHSQLAKWNGIYLVYVKKPQWRQVCSSLL